MKWWDFIYFIRITSFGTYFAVILHSPPNKVELMLKFANKPTSLLALFILLVSACGDNSGGEQGESAEVSTAPPDAGDTGDDSETPSTAKITSDPADKATYVLPGQSLDVHFPLPMDPASVESAFHVTDGNGNPIAGTFAWWGNGKTVLFQANEALALSSAYTITIDTSAKAMDGTTSTEPYRASFTTAVATLSNDDIAQVIDLIQNKVGSLDYEGDTSGSQQTLITYLQSIPQLANVTAGENGDVEAVFINGVKYYYHHHSEEPSEPLTSKVSTSSSPATLEEALRKTPSALLSSNANPISQNPNVSYVLPPSRLALIFQQDLGEGFHLITPTVEALLKSQNYSTALMPATLDYFRIMTQIIPEIGVLIYNGHGSKYGDISTDTLVIKEGSPNPYQEDLDAGYIYPGLMDYWENGIKTEKSIYVVSQKGIAKYFDGLLNDGSFVMSVACTSTSEALAFSQDGKITFIGFNNIANAFFYPPAVYTLFDWLLGTNAYQNPKVPASVYENAERPSWVYGIYKAMLDYDLLACGNTEDQRIPSCYMELPLGLSHAILRPTIEYVEMDYDQNALNAIRATIYGNFGTTDLSAVNVVLDGKAQTIDPDPGWTSLLTAGPPPAGMDSWEDVETDANPHAYDFVTVTLPLPIASGKSISVIVNGIESNFVPLTTLSSQNLSYTADISHAVHPDAPLGTFMQTVTCNPLSLIAETHRTRTQYPTDIPQGRKVVFLGDPESSPCRYAFQGTWTKQETSTGTDGDFTITNTVFTLSGSGTETFDSAPEQVSPFTYAQCSTDNADGSGEMSECLLCIYFKGGNFSSISSGGTQNWTLNEANTGTLSVYEETIRHYTDEEGVVHQETTTSEPTQYPVPLYTDDFLCPYTRETGNLGFALPINDDYSVPGINQAANRPLNGSQTDIVPMTLNVEPFSTTNAPTEKTPQ